MAKVQDRDRIPIKKHKGEDRREKLTRRALVKSDHQVDWSYNSDDSNNSGSTWHGEGGERTSVHQGGVCIRHSKTTARREEETEGEEPREREFEEFPTPPPRKKKKKSVATHRDQKQKD